MGDVMEEACSGELYNMILSCVGDGSALNITKKTKSNNADIECGYEAWRRLKEWFLDNTQKNTMAQHFKGKLQDLRLDVNATATN
eukprot:1560628-Ditylum_brightwellii.AAC.1